jgi:hypothetical protein
VSANKKMVLPNSGTNQKILFLFHSFWIKLKFSTFTKKKSGTHQNVLVLLQSFWIKLKRSTFAKKLVKHIKTFWINLQGFLDLVEMLLFCKENSGTHQTALVSFQS